MRRMASGSAPGPAAEEQRRWKIIDTKLLSKPSNFDGSEAAWPQWSFKLLAYVHTLDAELYKEMSMVASLSEDDATNDSIDLRAPGLDGASRQLYHMLVLLLEGKAFSMQRPIPQGEGLLVWRKLVKEFEPDLPASSLGRMRKLMSWKFGVATIESDMNEFEVAVQTHEK